MGADPPPWHHHLASPRSRSGSGAGGPPPPPFLKPAPFRRGGGSGRFKGHPPGAWRRSARGWAVLAAAGLVAVCYAAARTPPSPTPSVGRGAAALVRSPAHPAGPSSSSPLGCVAWRQTGACSPYAERDAPRDKACHERVWIGSGFCECAGGAIAKPVPCGRHGGFTCARECAAVSLGSGGTAAAAAAPAAPPPLGDPAPRLPSNLSCEAGGVTDGVIAADGASARAALAVEASAAARAAAGLDAAWAAPPAHGPARAAADAAAARLWASITAAAASSWAASTPPGRRVALPERRTDGRDWVRDGVRMPGRDVRAAAAALAAFQAAAPPYPAAAADGSAASASSSSSSSSVNATTTPTFAGRGVVILGGGLTYTVPAWVALHMLRRSGCALPVEVWFPAAEAPTPGLASALAELGAGVRLLPAAPPPSNGGLGPRGAGGGGGGGPAGGGDLSGFTMKVAALVLSRFREVLFLDSDNVPVSDPAALFEAPAFKRTGALLWPDYWASTAAPELASILGVPSLPAGSFESGQLVFDKARAWAGLMAASYFNIESSLYYELFSGFMGKGDKEGFAHGLAAAGVPYAVAPTPAGAVGRARVRCALNQRVCAPGFAGNTMTQHAFPMVEEEEEGTGGASPSSASAAAAAAATASAPPSPPPPSSPPTIAFLHANLSPKWNLALPASPAELSRRWVTVQPGGRDFPALAVEAGLPDLEAEAFAIAARFACAPFVRPYAAALAASLKAAGASAGAAAAAAGGGGGGGAADAAAAAATATSAKPAPDAPPALPPTTPLSTGLPPHTLHPANPGIDFRAAYRWGLDGPFQAWAGCTAGDGLVHFINAHARPWGAWAGRVGRWAVGRERYFVPF